jgi:hypothetical protein
MSTVDREPIWAALFQRLQDRLQDQPFKTMSRRHYKIPTPDEQPALYLVQGVEDENGSDYGVPAKLVLHGFILAYDVDRAPDGETPGQESELLATALNGYVKAIGEAVGPDPAHEVQTLGDLVERCWIHGNTTMNQGVLTKQGFIQIPIHIAVA